MKINYLLKKIVKKSNLKKNQKLFININFKSIKKIFFSSIIIIILIFGLITFFTFSKSKNIYYSTMNQFFDIKAKNLQSNVINKFYNILPKKNLNLTNEVQSLNDLFNSRQLFINDINLTNEYVHYIRQINEEEEKKYTFKYYENITPDDYSNKTRPNQYSFQDYFYLCKNGTFINSELRMGAKISNEPLISIIVSSYNKEKKILQTIRSIQNQSLKNIEIIIVDDCSTDNSANIFNYLLNTDPRVRIFSHLKNMGVWRTRIDGFLYSRGKYILFFDMEDLLSDNYILQDTYNIMTKYKLDSVKFSFIFSRKKKKPFSHYFIIKYDEEDRKIVYGKKPLKFSLVYATIWSRLTRANILTKGLYTLNLYILNAYKNLWEDHWWNRLINKMSFSHLFINRVGYIYLLSRKGEGTIKIEDNLKQHQIIKEFIYFWLFDYYFLPKEDNKTSIINNLVKFNNSNNTVNKKPVNLGYLVSKFPPYELLLNSLIEDNFVNNKDKEIARSLLIDYNKKFSQ